MRSLRALLCSPSHCPSSGDSSGSRRWRQMQGSLRGLLFWKAWRALRALHRLRAQALRNRQRRTAQRQALLAAHPPPAPPLPAETQGKGHYRTPLPSGYSSMNKERPVRDLAEVIEAGAVPGSREMPRAVPAPLEVPRVSALRSHRPQQLAYLPPRPADSPPLPPAPPTARQQQLARDILLFAHQQMGLK
mmetsp:Transcript_11458/g.17225  ORF Transcript_11458/g.17225 Transcript_11458/m.17225 type:complete len:190 (+) Transcript_11458:72-641(+)